MHAATTNDTRDIAAPPQGRLALSVDDAVRQSGLGRSTLYELMQTGQLAYAKIGARRLILVDDLRALLAAHRHPGAPVANAAPLVA